MNLPEPAFTRRPLALAVAAVLAASLALALIAGGAHRQARGHVDERRDRALARVAARIQANIASQTAQAALRSWNQAHHQVPDPSDPPPASELPAIDPVEAVVRRWLSGYLPYEVDAGSSASRSALVATSTPGLARALALNPPLIPPAQQHRPPQGRALDLVTTLARGDRAAGVYVEIAYGPERAGLQLELRRRGGAWLVASLAG